MRSEERKHRFVQPASHCSCPRLRCCPVVDILESPEMLLSMVMANGEDPHQAFFSFSGIDRA